MSARDNEFRDAVSRIPGKSEKAPCQPLEDTRRTENAGTLEMVAELKAVLIAVISVASG
jgi:hypothetical protein